MERGLNIPQILSRYFQTAPYWFSDSLPRTLWAAPLEATTSRCGPWRGLLPFSTCPPSLFPSCTPLPSQMRSSAPPLLCISTGVKLLLGLIKILKITYGGDPNTFQYLNGKSLSGCWMFGIWWLEYWTESNKMVRKLDHSNGLALPFRCRTLWFGIP